MADPTDDPTGVLPWKWVPEEWRTGGGDAAASVAPAPDAEVPTAPDAEVPTDTAAVPSGDAPAPSSAAPSDADAIKAGAPPASTPDKKPTPVVSDLAKFGAISKALASGDPLAAAAATGKAPDLAKLAAVQQLVAPPAPAAAMGGAPAPIAPAPAAVAPTFSPIPPLVTSSAAQPEGPPGMPPQGPPGPPPPPGPGGPVPPPGAMGAPPPPDAVTGEGAVVAPPVPPVPPPDAISGATPAFPGTGPTIANTPGLRFSMEGGPGAGPLPPTDEYGQPLGKIASLTDEQAKQWAQTASPDDLLEQHRLLDVRQRNKALNDAAEIDAANLKKLKQDQDDLVHANAAAQVKADRIVADAVAIANKKTDPNHWMSTRTAGQRIRDILLAAAGGLLQARQGPGARNIGLDMFQKEVDQDIDAQKQDIENGRHAISVRQNAVAEEFKRNGNLYEAAEKVRLATYEAAVRRMQSEQQNFDPRGTSFLNYAGAIRDMQARAGEHVEKIRETAMKEDLEKRKSAREDATAAATIQHQRNEDSIAYGRLSLDKNKERADNTVWTPQQLAAINRTPDGPPLPIPPIAMSQAEYGKWLSNQKTGGEMAQQTQQEQDRQNDRVRQFSVGSVAPRPVVGADGKTELQHGPLINADGKPWLVSDTGEHKAVSDKYLAASAVSDIINEVLAIRKDVGGESGVFNSDAYQRLKVLQNRLVILQKSGTQGMSSDEDMNKIAAAVGSDDITSFRSRAAGLKEALQHTETELNKSLRIGNYTGPAIKFTNPYDTPEAKETAQDVRDEKLFEKPAGGNEDAAFKREFLAEYRRRTAGKSPDELRAFEDHPLTEDEVTNARYSRTPGAGGEHWVPDINEPDTNRVHTDLTLSPQQRDILNDVAAKFDPDVTLAQKDRISELGASARQTDAEGAAARALLERVAAEGHTKKLRTLASDALSAAAAASIPDSEQASPPPAATSAYETLPPPPPPAPPKKKGGR